jgi:ubiquinone/menaquinone biosynthesis C-methylase UbiE
MAFDNNWETGIYSEQKQINKFPFDWVVSTVNRIFSNAPSEATNAALELGCGTGNNLKFLSEFGFNFVHGIDGSPSALDLARDHLKDCDDNIKLTSADFISIPEENSIYDLALDRGSITHNNFESCNSILDEIYRVLKPEGYLISVMFSSSHSAVQNANLISRSHYNAFKAETNIEQGVKTSFFNITDIFELFVKFEILSCVQSANEELIGTPSRSVMWNVIARKPL